MDAHEIDGRLSLGYSLSVGKKEKRTLYLHAPEHKSSDKEVGTLVGYVDSPTLAQRICEAYNDIWVDDD